WNAVLQWLALEKALDLLDHGHALLAVGFHGLARLVWCQEDVLQPAEGAVLRQRLLLEHIQRRPQAAVPQLAQQRIFVDCPGPRRIDEESIICQQAQLSRPD